METKNRTFNLGQTVASTRALETLDPVDIGKALVRHACCDWGDCSEEDAAENEFALDQHFSLFSVYHDRNGAKFWIITEADRSETLISLPEDL